MVSLPAWLKCRCFRPSLPGDDDTPAPKKMSSSAADAQGFRTDQVSGAEAFTGVAAREPVQLPRAVSYPGKKVEKERVAKLFKKKAPTNAGSPADILPQLRIAPDTSTITSKHVEVASRVNSIKAVYPSRQHSASSSSKSLSPRMSSDSQATAAAAAVASTAGLTPSDIAITAAENTSATSSFVQPTPALPMFASAAASAAAQQPRTGAGLDELDPDMFVIKDLDSGKKYDLQQGLVVKDLTTGQMYGLDKTSSDACGESSTHLTDIASGRKITLDEFSGVLGNDSTFTRSNIRMPQSCSSDAPSLHQLPTAATIAPSQEPGLQALAHGFTGSRPSHGGHTDKPHTCVKSLSLLRHQVKALPLTSLCLTPKGQALDHSQGPSQWASASRTGSLVRRPRNFRQQRQKGSDAASAGSPPTTEGIKAERMGWDDFSRHEYLNPQGAQELRAQRQASG
ncbi:TPA: hypothetical protein ACH3X3_009184 [Trebouxia sp. C0006]